MKKPNAAVLAAAAGLRPAQSTDKLKIVREKAARARDLELEIEDLESKIKERRTELTRLLGGGKEPGEIVAMFEELGLDSLGLERQGNSPAYDVKIKPFYSASIPKDPEGAAAALDHIERVWKTPDIIKTSLSADFGRGERKRALQLEKFLEKSKIDYSSKVGVHAQTLTAEIRRRFESGSPLSPKELSIVGGYVGTVAKLSKRED